MTFFLGIDFGTSGARAIALDLNKTVCAQVSESFTETEPAAWANHWKAILFKLIQQIPVSVRSGIRAIAINGTSSTALLCDGTGQPLDAPMLYNDARAILELEALKIFFKQAAYTKAADRQNVLNTTSTLVKLLWWQRQSFFADAKYLMHQADWLAFLLHGQPGISDYHNSLKVGYDVVKLEYPDWLEALGVRSLLPKVVEPGTEIAPIQPAIAQELGLPPTCKIHAGTTDSIAAFLASGANVSGEAVTSLGSTLVLKLLSQKRVENETYGIYSHRLGNLWLVGGASNTGGAVLKQFFTTEELNRLSSQISVSKPSSLDYYPLLKPGERFPINDPSLLPRLNPQPSDRVAFLHGLLESMARIETRGYTLLQQFGADTLTRVYTAGGGSANATWTAIRARYLNVPMMPTKHTEAAYGTALLVMKAYESKSSDRTIET